MRKNCRKLLPQKMWILVLFIAFAEELRAASTLSEDFLEEMALVPPPGQRQRDRYRGDSPFLTLCNDATFLFAVAMQFVQPLWGSTFQTNCNGESIIHLRVSISADKDGLDGLILIYLAIFFISSVLVSVKDWNIFYKINGKFRGGTHKDRATTIID